MIPKTDPEYTKIRRILRELRRRTDFEKERKEMLNLHETRKSLGLMSSKQRYHPEYVYDAILMDMSYRGRLVTMIKKINNTTALLDRALMAFRTYVYTEYRDNLGSTQNDRYSNIDRICKPILDFIAECSDHIAGIELLIKDIDQANFQLDRVVKILSMIQESKGPRNV